MGTLSDYFFTLFLQEKRELSKDLRASGAPDILMITYWYDPELIPKDDIWSDLKTYRETAQVFTS